MRSPTRLEVTVLGGFRVAVGGKRVPDAAWRNRRAAAVIKLLALAPEHALHREHLLDALWPDLDPTAAANNLRGALHHARRALVATGADADDFLVRDGELIRLGQAERVRVDLTLFESAVARVWRSPDPAFLNVAVASYGGELLPDDPYEDWAADRRTVVRASIVALLARAARQREEHGQPEAALALLARLLAVEPLDESAHAATIRLLATSGRRREALAHYDRYASRLREEIGADPEPATRALRDGIAAGVLPAAQATTQPAPSTTPLVVGQPPLPDDPAIGRERETEEVLRLLRAHRLVTLTGPGGVGKTRLALAVVAAASETEAFPDGIGFVDLAPLTDPDLVLPALARAVGVRAFGSEPATAIAERLGAARLLLVVDNVEHLAAAGPGLASLLPACPGLRLLATGRSRLRVRGEQAYPVAPLAVPGAPDRLRPRAPTAAVVAEADAVALFVARARAVDPEFRLSDDNAGLVAEVTRHLDGLPLAIELAAARSRLLSPAALLAQLASPLDVLAAGPWDAPARQRTLRATVAWSYRLLDPPAQALFAALAAFSGGATLDAAAAVAGTVPPALLDPAAVLVDVGLVRRLDDPGGILRLGMPATVVAFARERLVDRGDAAELRTRHAIWFLDLAEAAAPELTGPYQQEWLDRLEREHDNLRAGLVTFAGAAVPEAASPGTAAGGERRLRLAAALWRFWWIRGFLLEGRRHLEDALAAATDAPAALRAVALDGAGALAESLGDLAAATDRHAAAAMIWRGSGDANGLVRALTNLGLVADKGGDPKRATALHEEALTIARHADDRAGVAGCLANLGFAALDRGEPEEAANRLGEAMVRLRALGDQRNAAAVLGGLGVAAFLTGDFPRAVAVQEEALAMARALGDAQGVADALANLGHACQQLGDPDRAAGHFSEALERYRALHDESGVAFALTHLGRLARLRGDDLTAWRLLREAAPIAWRLGERIALAETFEALAPVLIDRGEPALAARLAGAADGLRQAATVPLPAVHHAERAQTFRRLDAALGTAKHAAARADGRALSFEQALAVLPPPGS
jgi:predicted ATPase/DNA-binding SARP family transcriptional activator